MVRHKSLRGAIVIGLFLVALAAVPIAAKDEPASQTALAVSPAIIEEVLEPGKDATFTVLVHNVTSFPLPVKGFVRDMTLQDVQLDESAKAKLDASRWFSIEEPDFILQPNQTRTVKGTIRAPADAAPGGHYATVYFQPLVPQEALSPSTAYISSRVGALAFLVVKGDIERKAAFTEPLSASTGMGRGPIKLSFSVGNSGNVHILPAGSVAIYDWHGKKLASLDIPTGLILPKTSKSYEFEWQPPQLVGKYIAELTFTYDRDQRPLTAKSAEVWAAPWLEAGTVLLLLAGGVFIIAKTRSRWRKAWHVLRGKNDNKDVQV
jgi:hypothetical protein